MKAVLIFPLTFFLAVVVFNDYRSTEYCGFVFILSTPQM